MKKKLISLFLATIMLLSLVMVSCTNRKDQTSMQPEKTTNQIFDDLLNDVFTATLISDTITLHYTLRDSSKFDIDKSKAKVTLGSFDYPSDNEINEYRTFIERLDNISRSELSSDRKYDYDIMKYDFDLFDDYLEYFYYHDITGQDNIPAMLPVLFAEFNFNSKEDVKLYLKLLETTKEYFASLTRFQQKKSELGLFMNNDCANEIIETCKSIIDEKDNNIFIKTFESKINSADFLSSDEKKEYSEENKSILNSTVISAYEKLIDSFEKLLGTGKNNSGVLNLTNGKKYYEYRLKAMGLSLTADELIQICDTRLDIALQTIQDLSRNSAVQNFSGKYASKHSADQLLKNLINSAAKDFPSLPDGVEYRVEKIDESIKDFVSPAFYFTPRLDDYKNNVIYYNSDYQTNYEYMFELMAHEGYPGHMLQLTNLMASSFSNYRKTVNFSTYNEAWTTYVESYIYKYAITNQTVLRYYQACADFETFLMLRVELGVNYQGWNQYAVVNFLRDYLNDPTSYGAEYYKYFKNNPIDVLKYSAGYLELIEIKDNFKTELGTEYSDLLFHQTYLDCGTAPFAHVKNYFEKTIDKTKK